MLELSFENKQLRALCERENRAKAVLGDEVAKRLRARIADIDAASTYVDLVIGSPRIVEYKDRECLVISLTNDLHLIMIPNHRNNPVDTDGKLDWGRVRRLKLIEIGEL